MFPITSTDTTVTEKSKFIAVRFMVGHTACREEYLTFQVGF
jgi:hypothetical protein